MSEPDDLKGDLRAGLGALRQVLDGIAGFGRAANGATKKLGRLAEHAADSELLYRIVVAGFGAAAMRAGQEIRAAVMSSPGAPRPDQAGGTLACSKHGAQPWTGTMMCTECGLFQWVGLGASHGFDHRCWCGARLLVSARPICRGCFAEIVAAGSWDEDRGTTAVP